MSIPLRALPALLWGEPAPDQVLWRNVLIDIRLPRVLFAVVAGRAGRVRRRHAGAVPQSAGRAGPDRHHRRRRAGRGRRHRADGRRLLDHRAGGRAGSLLATLCAYAVGRRVPGVAGLLLAGVAITAVAFSLIGLLTFMANDAQLRDLTFWNMGSLARANWTLLAFLGPWVALLSAWMMTQWRAMNALLLGEREAQHLGYALKPLRVRLVLASALIIGPLVAVTGSIVFVGLVVPHLARMTLGANHRWLLPASVAGGGLALVLADWASRVALTPAELPIGLITGLVGGPFFLWLLARGRRVG